MVIVQSKKQKKVQCVMVFMTYVEVKCMTSAQMTKEEMCKHNVVRVLHYTWDGIILFECRLDS